MVSGMGAWGGGTIVCREGKVVTFLRQADRIKMVKEPVRGGPEVTISGQKEFIYTVYQLVPRC